MPGAGVHIVVDRVGGSKVTDAADRDAWHHASWWGARVTVTGAPFCLLGDGCAGTARQRRPQRTHAPKARLSQ